MPLPWDSKKPMGTHGSPPGPPPFMPGNFQFPPPPPPSPPPLPIPTTSINDIDPLNTGSSSIHSSFNNFSFNHHPRPFDGGTSFPNHNNHNPSSHITFNGPSPRSRRASSTKTNCTANNLKRSSPSHSGKSSAKSTHTKGCRRKKVKEDTKKVAQSVKSQSKSALGRLKGLASRLKKKLSKKRKQTKNSLFKSRVQLENPTDVAEGLVPEGGPAGCIVRE